jgi:hypothetical protein
MPCRLLADGKDARKRIPLRVWARLQEPALSEQSESNGCRKSPARSALLAAAGRGPRRAGSLGWKALAQAERRSERSRHADFRPLLVPRELTIACRNK